MTDKWQEKIRPSRLERRYEFPDYQALSDFLERAAEVSEREDLFPDMGFGRNYVNVTIHVAEEEKELGERERRLAEQLDDLFKADTQEQA